MTCSTKPSFSPFFREGVLHKPKEYERDVNHLREWLKGQPHLPPLSEDHLYLFLHSCEQKLAKTKDTIESYYTLRTHSTDLFGNRNPVSNEIQMVLDLVELVPLQRYTPEGYQVILYRLSNTDASKFVWLAALKLFFMFNDMQLAEDGLLPGYVVIFDMKGVTMAHLAKVTLSSIRKFMNYIQDCHPARLKAVHVINTIGLMDKVLALIKPFMKSELMQMLHLHGPVESLEKYMPLDILPEEYGGKGESTTKTHAKKRKLFENDYVEWFKEEEKLKVDEKRCNGKHPNAENPYVVEGSFRRLSID